MNKQYTELQNCQLCPQLCGVNRYEVKGFCNAGAEIEVNLCQLHYGEEPVISGSMGSGTIFFTHCNLRCVFCQNFRISALGSGRVISEMDLAEKMLALQEQGAHNINLVSPTQYSIPLTEVIKTAKASGLRIPVVWNSNGFERVEILQRLQGLVDIYLPDCKYAHGIYAGKYSQGKNYPMLARSAILEMHRQVGKLQIVNDIAVKGMIIRLLVLPHKLAGTVDTLHWIADHIGTDVYISLMGQYYPTWQASNYPELSRGIYTREYDEAREAVENLGFTNGFFQELSADSAWTPEFERVNG
jgi:putative pyruvate formate lyase activating enzyme